MQKGKNGHKNNKIYAHCTAGIPGVFWVEAIFANGIFFFLSFSFLFFNVSQKPQTDVSARVGECYAESCFSFYIGVSNESPIISRFNATTINGRYLFDGYFKAERGTKSKAQKGGHKGTDKQIGRQAYPRSGIRPGVFFGCLRAYIYIYIYVRVNI